jgi:calcineurin-like phosphoesterase family protein
MKVFVTSNQQFGRKGAIRAYKRPFIDTEDMNVQLVDAWNSVVAEEDIVYVLGNFAWDPETLEVVVKSLNGNIIVLSGEFDNAARDVADLMGIIDIDYLYNAIEEHPEANIVMSYWPLTEWPGKKNGTYSIIGYPHKEYKTNHKTRVINCACDLWDFKPVEVSKIVELLSEVSEQH